MRDSQTALEIKNLTKYYRKFQALNDLSFKVERGDFFAFLGPNGAGKTTTINVICGLARHETGQVRVFGYDVAAEYRESRKCVGLCAQEFNFDPFLTIRQLLVYQAGYFGILEKKARQRADELMERFRIIEKANQDYRSLSGGMKRRLLICRALMHDPELIILDEPTAGADLELKYHIWEYLEELNREGKTIFLTTHYMEEAQRLCRTIAIIHKGEIVRIGAREAVLQDKSLESVFLEVTREPERET